MIVPFIVAALALAAPGPLDAFRANLAAARVKVRFKCDLYGYGGVNYEAIRPQLEKFNAGPGPAEKPEYIAEGRWDFDGSCEHYVTRVTGGTKYVPSPLPGPGLVPQSEVLWDGDTYAYHSLPGGTIHVEIRVAKPPIIVLGPFTWKNIYRFDHELDADYRGAEIEHKSGERQGRKVDVEIYKGRFMQFQTRMEIDYDPAIGYVPRFVRHITYGMEKGRSIASVSEVSIMDAKPSAAGGFVPTEWYLVGYHIDDFDTKYPEYSEETRLTPSDGPHLAHFKVVKMEEQKGPVVMTEADGDAMILGLSGFVTKKGGFPHLSMGEVKRLLGRRLYPENKPAMPDIDVAELHEFDHPRRTPWIAYVIVGLACVVLVFLVIWGPRPWKRGSVWLLLLACLAAAGCGYRPVLT